MRMTIKDLHRVNAVFLIAFVIIHMGTHLSALWGVDAYNATQKALRLVYQNPIIEPLLLASCCFQIVAGFILMFRSIRKGLRGFWQKLQVISGGVFLFFIVEHLIALVFARWVEGLDTNFYWPASVMDGAPFTWYFVPYYFLGVSALFVHMGCAVRLMLMRNHKHRMASFAFWSISLAGIVSISLVIPALLGMYYDITLPEEWVAYLRVFSPKYIPSN
jgi:succinate dehydrogenase/fumarate reductase cytochrome b subunit